jgi:hypothetical protein
MEHESGCNVSSKLNFTIGALSATAACVIGYFLYNWIVG